MTPLLPAATPLAVVDAVAAAAAAAVVAGSAVAAGTTKGSAETAPLQARMATEGVRHTATILQGHTVPIKSGE